MALEIFHDQMFKKECTGSGDHFRYCLHPKRHSYQPSFHAHYAKGLSLYNILKVIFMSTKYFGLYTLNIAMDVLA